jgi:hypothetical protein
MSKNITIDVGLLPEQVAYFYHKERIEDIVMALNEQIVEEGGLNDESLLVLVESIKRYIELKKSPVNQFKIRE